MKVSFCLNIIRSKLYLKLFYVSVLVIPPNDILTLSTLLIHNYKIILLWIESRNDYLLQMKWLGFQIECIFV